jgi:hypothetical protein
VQKLSRGYNPIPTDVILMNNPLGSPVLRSHALQRSTAQLAEIVTTEYSPTAISASDAAETGGSSAGMVAEADT